MEVATASPRLMIREGDDCLCDDSSQLPYKLLKNLGHGRSAIVEMVEDVNTGSVYARKRFSIYGLRSKRKSIFDNEIKIIRRLSPHHHIIRVFATYVTRREVGLILHPVADKGDLETFLHEIREDKAAELSHTHRSKVLKSAFGCLASGLAFMHGQKIRHKDIKPHNILIHQGSVIYTDFGYSLDHSIIGGGTTDGRPDAFTRRFCAPEVSDYDPRNAKSDIFSLGCVFMEILSVLHDDFPQQDPERPYYESITDSQLQSTVQGFGRLGIIASDMLSFRPEDRPSAEDVFSKLKEDEADRFCAKCLAMMSLEAEETPCTPDLSALTRPSEESVSSYQHTSMHMRIGLFGNRHRDIRHESRFSLLAFLPTFWSQPVQSSPDSNSPTPVVPSTDEELQKSTKTNKHREGDSIETQCFHCGKILKSRIDQM